MKNRRTHSPIEKRQNASNLTGFGWRYFIAVAFGVLLPIAGICLHDAWIIIQTDSVKIYPYKFPFLVVAGIVSALLEVILLVLNTVMIKRYSSDDRKGEILLIELLLAVPSFLISFICFRLTALIAFISQFW